MIGTKPVGDPHLRYPLGTCFTCGNIVSIDTNEGHEANCGTSVPRSAQRRLEPPTAEDALADLIKWEQLPEPTRELVFAWPRRKWRFDFAWKMADDLKVALEVEGGAFAAGRHTRGAGFVRDLEKYNEAALAGWILLRVTPDMVRDGTAIALIKRALQPR